MVKSLFSPTSSAWRRKIFTPMEWKVPSHGMPSTTLADDLADAVLHLARRLVGEGDGEDLAGPGAAEAEDVGDAHGEHAGLAGAGAGQHQHRAVERLDRLALLRIEPGEIGRAAARRGAGARGDAAGRGLRRFGRLDAALQRVSHGGWWPLILMAKDGTCARLLRGLRFRGRGAGRGARSHRHDAGRPSTRLWNVVTDSALAAVLRQPGIRASE